jgi:hypothetical protein
VLGTVTTTLGASYSAGVRGRNNSIGGSGIGVHGLHAGSGWGVAGETTNGGTGVYGFAGGAALGYGVGGVTLSGAADSAGVHGRVYANAAGVSGVHGLSLSTGVFGIGVRGDHSGAGNGVYGSAALANVGAAGVLGQLLGTGAGGVGVHGHHSGGGYGVYGNAAGAGGVGVAGNQGAPTGYAGYFSGRVHVTGLLSKGGGAFKIDHPLDPANKYLQHSFVESPDMKNVYDGVVRTDRRGFATVRLPRYFQALNRDFRYQLTIVGRSFAQALIWKEIAGNRFTIKTDRPNTKVSWQVTGIRKDRWANANRIAVEQAKAASELGNYLNPELYRASRAKSVVDLPPEPARPPTAPRQTRLFVQR